MTLAHYSGRAVGIDPDTRTVNRTFPWGRGRGSALGSVGVTTTDKPAVGGSDTDAPTENVDMPQLS